MVNAGSILILGLVIGGFALLSTKFREGGLPDFLKGLIDKDNNEPSAPVPTSTSNPITLPPAINPEIFTDRGITVQVVNPKSENTPIITQRIIERPEGIPLDLQIQSSRRRPSPNPREIADTPKSNRQAEFERRAETIPDKVKFSTSLPNAPLVTGPQFTRGTDRAQQIQKEEAKRSEEIFRRLFGNVQNPDF